MLLFKEKYNIPFTFDIVGGGDDIEEALIKQKLAYYRCSEINFRGMLNHDEVKFLFDSCNVGVCYIPITEYYQHQPPTKLYEYLLSGMACIATNTISASNIITSDNGILINDDIESVCEGLYRMSQKLKTFSSLQIVESSMKYSWETIIRYSFLPIFDSSKKDSKIL